MQMEMSDPTKILQKRLAAVGIDSSGFAHKSFRIGMACQVMENQRIVFIGVRMAALGCTTLGVVLVIDVVSLQRG